MLLIQNSAVEKKQGDEDETLQDQTPESLDELSFHRSRPKKSVFEKKNFNFKDGEPNPITIELPVIVPISSKIVRFVFSIDYRKTIPKYSSETIAS